MIDRLTDLRLLALIVERGSHAELLASGGRYFELYTKQAGLEANRYINPGEKDPETELKKEAGSKEPATGIGAVARDLLGMKNN